LRRAKYARVQDYFIASEHTPPAVIQNASVACSLWMAALGPFFGWGATGTFWPALLAAICFPLGLSLMSCVRAPLLAFMDDALIHDRSVTIHQFIAQRHGNDSHLRLLAAALTVVAFAALAIGAAFALARSLMAGLDAAVPTSVLVLGMLILAGGYALIAGNTGILRSTQLQLGMIYFGLIGATALLLYELISDLTQLPPYGIFGIVFVAAFCAVLVGYRRSRYVDTSPIRKTFDAAGLAAAGHEPLSARLLVRLEKIFNVSIFHPRRLRRRGRIDGIVRNRMVECRERSCRRDGSWCRHLRPRAGRSVPAAALLSPGRCHQLAADRGV
jgi:hypothetical protein